MVVQGSAEIDESWILEEDGARGVIGSAVLRVKAEGRASKAPIRPDSNDIIDSGWWRL